MARFSLGREEDNGEEEGPSNLKPIPKKQRLYLSSSPENSNPAAEQHQVEDDAVEEEREEHGRGEEESSNHEDSRQHDDDQQKIEETKRGSPSPSRNLVGPVEGEAISVTIVDPDVLDCPICLEPLRIPVFQCENGHIACSSCCVRIGNKCASCSWPIGYNRCRAMEKVLESVKISCRYIIHGCNESMSYSEKNDHEKICRYQPCSCPIPDCEFVGFSKNLYEHFRLKHLGYATQFDFNHPYSHFMKTDEKYRILQEHKEGSIFIINHRRERAGHLLNVIHVGPTSSEKGHSYDLFAGDHDSCITLKSFAESISDWNDNLPLKRSLLVPSDLIRLGSGIDFELCICRHYNSPVDISKRF